MTALRALDAAAEAWLLNGKGKWVEETTTIAALIRNRTEVKNCWGRRVPGWAMKGNVTRAIRRVSENPARIANLASLEAMLVSRDSID